MVVVSGMSSLGKNNQGHLTGESAAVSSVESKEPVSSLTRMIFWASEEDIGDKSDNGNAG